mmetsp:Transcript_588/g.1286  ORF Transcript_588/g.1286 Transcript_588/m.1286 type:complete len:225 (+) Transcript_588:1500-2174(+)
MANTARARLEFSRREIVVEDSRSSCGPSTRGVPSLSRWIRTCRTRGARGEHDWHRHGNNAKRRLGSGRRARLQAQRAARIHSSSLSQAAALASRCPHRPLPWPGAPALPSPFPLRACSRLAVSSLQEFLYDRSTHFGPSRLNVYFSQAGRSDDVRPLARVNAKVYGYAAGGLFSSLHLRIRSVHLHAPGVQQRECQGLPSDFDAIPTLSGTAVLKDLGICGTCG